MKRGKDFCLNAFSQVTKVFSSLLNMCTLFLLLLFTMSFHLIRMLHLWNGKWWMTYGIVNLHFSCFSSSHTCFSSRLFPCNIFVLFSIFFFCFNCLHHSIYNCHQFCWLHFSSTLPQQRGCTNQKKKTEKKNIIEMMATER